MTFLYVLLGITLFFAFILSIRGRVVIELDEDGEFYLAVKVLFLTIPIIPAKEPKPIRIKDYTPEKHKKRLRKNYQEYLKKQEKKQQKQVEKEKKKEQKKAESSKEKPPKRSISDWLDVATAVLKVLFERFFKHLRIKVARMRINVATGDAASTAILYGVVIQSVAYIVEILDSVTNLDGMKKADIAVNADYLSESTTFDLKFVFSIRIWQLFSIVFGVAGRAIKKLLDTSPDKKQAPSQGSIKRKKKRKAPQKKQPSQVSPSTNSENK